MRVPAVLTWTKVLPPGSIVDEPLHIVDIYPTLLRLAGATIEQKHPLDGYDAWETIVRGAPSPHAYILHNVTPFQGAIRAGDWKLIHNGQLGANAIEFSGNEKWELFNVAEDISEKDEVSQQHPEIVERLRKQLSALAAEAAAPHLLPNQPPAGFRTPQVWGMPDELP